LLRVLAYNSNVDQFAGTEGVVTGKAKVLDAGGKLMVSAPTAAEVEATLSDYVSRGAKIVTPVTQVGKDWVAACTIPATLKDMDSTQTLQFSDVAQALETQSTMPDDGCRVVEMGFKRIVYGPSRLIVQRRVEEMKQFGAQLLGDIEEENGEWVAVCDTGGANNPGFRW